MIVMETAITYAEAERILGRGIHWIRVRLSAGRTRFDPRDTQ